MKLFRVVSANGRTDYVVTNDLAQNDTSVAQQACSWRWKIDQFHREVKQLTGIEGCQCRLARTVRNHIGCVVLGSTQAGRLSDRANHLSSQAHFIR